MNQHDILWAKKSASGAMQWLSLPMHLADTAEIGRILWDRWLCTGARQNIIGHTRFPSSERSNAEQARALFVFICAAHDLGKATPAFQSKDTRLRCTGLIDQADREEYADKCRLLDEKLAHRLKAAGFDWPNALQNRDKTPHARCSQCLLSAIAGEDEHLYQISAILGAHHGKPQDKENEDLNASYPENFYGIGGSQALWKAAQTAIASWALKEAGFESYDALPRPNRIASVILSGLLIMADWISSNETLFPLLDFDDFGDISKCRIRAENAYNNPALNLTEPWKPLNDMPIASALHDYYGTRFDFITPNSLQKAMIDLAREGADPGIFAVEAPMGCGKTETALAAAEILAERSGRNGVFFALPTQATSNGIFPRLISWINHFHDSSKHSVKLSHCRAEFNDDYTNLIKSQGNSISKEFDTDDNVIVNDWFSGRKKSLLTDFAVGTVDQILMAAFSQKHVMLRHLGLVNKVVIIDECHAYDAYMSVYLKHLLAWLGQYRVPTIILSATLPAATRQDLVESYMNGWRFQSPRAQQKASVSTPDWVVLRDYPLITYLKDSQAAAYPVPSDAALRRVSIVRLDETMLCDKLTALTINGGCIGVIVNSVRRAQEIAQTLRERFGTENTILFHARFMMPDRSEIEKQITQMLGKPGRETHRPKFKIIVGTQVLEQSLDIDFDVLFTDIAPMDLLIQRIGRLHRHNRPRPKPLNTPQCFVMGTQNDGSFDKASAAIYSNYLLMRTNALLPETLVLPDDISSLVDHVYNENYHLSGLPDDIYNDACMKYTNRNNRKEQNAKSFQVGAPDAGRRSSLNGWLTRTASDNISEQTAVRDIIDSIEVFFVQKMQDGTIHLLNKDHTQIAQNEAPEDDIAREIRKYSINLPLAVIKSNDKDKIAFDETIDILEKCSSELSSWQQSRWLKGELILILNENNEFLGLPDFILKYTKSDGLSYSKKEEE